MPRIDIDVQGLHMQVADSSSRRGWWRAIAWIGIVIDHGKPIRVSLLVLAVSAFAAVNVDQVAELFLIAVWTDPSITRYLSLLAGSALAGLAIWYTARQAYRLVYPRWPSLQDPRAAWLRDWLPRLLGAAVPLVVLLGFLLALHTVPHGTCSTASACSRRGWRAAGLLLESMVLIGFFITRRRWVNVWRQRTEAMPLGMRASHEPRVHHLRMLGRVPLGWFMAIMALNVLATVLVVWQPRMLDGVGPLAILLLGASFMCMSGGFLCMLADRRGVPLLTMLLLISLLMHALHLNDNHRVRQYPAMSTHQHPATEPAESRPDFTAYANAWLDSRCQPTQPCPVIVVSSEGGGIRSAAWTAMVLSRLTAQVQAHHPRAGGEPLLTRYVFAASGVSGGSLGLASYVALLRQPSSADAAHLELRAQTLLSHDFLAPMLANMLFVDFTQRWLPGAWFDDRSRALTHAWEQAAQQQGMGAFAQPFSALYEHADGSVDTSSPALFLNSTTVEQGSRFVQHPFRPFIASPWTAAFDGSTRLDPRVPLSEVVLNSARFTYVSPAGTLETTPPVGVAPPVPATLQLVDGGYFENSGTTTLLEVIYRLRSIAAQREQPLRIIVLHISNDPLEHDFVAAHDPTHLLPLYTTVCPAPTGIDAAQVSGEVSAPIKALLDTRSARGEYARARLLASLHIDPANPMRGDVLWHFRLCPGNYPIPLGWTISTPVFDEMGRQLQQNYPLVQMTQWLDEQLSAAVAPPMSR
ncbi:MAG: hypothetical protein WA777_04780 [Rhodanobacter sp.]